MNESVCLQRIRQRERREIKTVRRKNELSGNAEGKQKRRLFSLQQGSVIYYFNLLKNLIASGCVLQTCSSNCFVSLKFSIIKKATPCVTLSCANIFIFTCKIFIRFLFPSRTGVGCYALSRGFLISWNKFIDSFEKSRNINLFKLA